MDRCSTALRPFPLLTVAAIALLVTLESVTAQPRSQERDALSLEIIMAHPDWVSRSPQQGYWADDSDSIYYWQKRAGAEQRDLYNVDLRGNSLQKIESRDMGSIDVSAGTVSNNYRLKVYARQGDIYVKDLRSGKIQQLTRTVAAETNPRFTSSNDKVIFTRADQVYIRELDSGLEYQVADLRAEDDPDEEEDDEYLDEQQLRLFDIIKLQKQREELAKEFTEQEQASDSTRVSLPWYLGKKNEIVERLLSPNEKWMLVILRKKADKKEGKDGSMPNYVTASGYVESKEVRTRVGTMDFADQQIVLLDLALHKQHEIDLSQLPSRDKNPLQELQQLRDGEKEPADEEATQEENEEDKFRDIQISSAHWSDDGSKVLLEIVSRDHKDRWLVRINAEDLDSEEKAESLTLEHENISLIHHEHNAAWIGREFRETQWLPDNQSLYFLSEADGYGHLYLYAADGSTEQLTSGSFEIRDPTLSRNGKQLYFRGNNNHPGIYEIFRIELASKKIEQLTHLGGMNRYELSPDESKLLITHSDSQRPPELYVKSVRSRGRVTQLTHTVSDEFKAIDWVSPDFVAIASSVVNDPIHSRVYMPVQEATAARPAVVFIHGAGYLQNAHQGWSSYFREFMFHTLLTQQGYVVLDMDYRASQGYGSDWRTAIYQRMGTPELEDLRDGVNWLVANANVDREKICTYGGSYGGFLTLMALFVQQDLFACGAALRPVTDWAHYNHGYTSNILNIPTIDPDAYARSSPIEFAEGLEKPLLIAHGMQDNNVFFQDSVRLVQRLIELEKQDWELAVYPIEAHGFREPFSWLDEYRRIFKLFKENLH